MDEDVDQPVDSGRIIDRWKITSKNYGPFLSLIIVVILLVEKPSLDGSEIVTEKLERYKYQVWT
jgi:hypothetical protein